MIPTVKERKKNVHVFMNSYPYLCRLSNTVPNPNIKVDSLNHTLDFIGDRLKLEDWKIVFEAISNDRSLHLISIRSRNSKARVVEEAESETQIRQLATLKSPVLFTNFVILKLTESLSKCISNSSVLTALVLERIPLNQAALNHLIQGLESCESLQQLSLLYTRLGDDECASLCHVLRNRLSLVWLNLTGCHVTEKGVNTICNLLKFQKLNRYGESWKQSLRYRPVNPNNMPGLRRLTLNHNPVGDAGVQIFVETLVDDLWLKALDLQSCEITMVGAEALLSLVKSNEFLSVVDIRGNSQVPASLVAAVVQQLATNNHDSNPEFNWLNMESGKSVTGSNSTSSAGRSSRFLSNTTLASKATSILPNKTRAPISNLSPAARSSSAKRISTTNNTPRLPWNSNLNNPTLRRGHSDQLIRTNAKNHQEILSELHNVKEQLKDVSLRLEVEKDRRIKIEKELEQCKKSLENTDNSFPLNGSHLHDVFNQFCNFYLNQNPQQNEKDSGIMKTSEDISNENIDSVIKIVNGDNNLGVDTNLKIDTNKDSGSTEENATTRVQYLFQRLISS